MKTFRDILILERMSANVERYLFSGNGIGGEPVMVRKPTNFIDLYKAKSLRAMPKDVRDFINGLKTITWMDLYGGVKPVKDFEFWQPHKGIFRVKTPVWFKVKTGSMLILMDTEGYDYPRFAARIKK